MSEQSEKQNTSHGPRSQERVCREAKALKKNMLKRKKQQAEREMLQKDKPNT